MGGRIRFSGRLVRLALGSMLDILHQKPFVRLSVKDFIWGYESPLVRLGNDILPPEEKLPFNKFGIFTGVRNCIPRNIFIRFRATMPDIETFRPSHLKVT